MSCDTSGPNRAEPPLEEQSLELSQNKSSLAGLHERNVATMNFGSGAATSGGGASGGVITGPDLEQIETEQLAFQSVSGEDKLRLLPSPWPADNLPATTSSLLSVASSKGLVAAAGPDTLVVTSTDSVRQSFINDSADGESRVKGYTPQATLQIPRVSQVIFSSDESCLVVAAEQGGGLAVYDTSALARGEKNPAFQLSTEGESVRQLLPNPNSSQELSRYFGVVTNSGHLLLADLQDQKLVQSSSGSSVFHDNVSCACWSRLGKQIIAGLVDGTAVQIDQQGAVKATVPEPPQLADAKDPSASSYPVTAIFWLETYDFLIIHTPINPPDSGANDDSLYHLAHKDKSSGSWTFSKFMDPCPPFGLERKPAHHFIQRLRDWLELSDALILASTAGTDVGLFTKSKKPLDPEHPVTDTYTFTQPPDQRRAATPIPVLEGSMDTSPIGMAIDLSVQEKAPKPIPMDETLDESPIPLPALYVLNNEGMLSMWYIVYNDAIRQNQPYRDLIAAGGPRPLSDQRQQPAATHAHPIQPTTGSAPFGNSAPAQSLPFGQRPPSQGQPQAAPGTPSTPSFGGASSIGIKQSPWGAPTSGAQFGKSTFGAPSTPAGSGFGQVGGMGANKGSVWGSQTQQSPQASQPQSGGSVFGGNASNQSPFLNLGNKSSAPQASPFAAFGSNTGKDNQPSLFGSKAPSLSAEPSGSTVSFGNGTSFGSGSTTFGIESRPSIFGSPQPSTSGGTFGKPSAPTSREENMGDDDTSSQSTAKPAGGENKNPFGLASGGFKLGSTFKGDGSAKDDLPKPKDAGAGLFGQSFGDALGDVGKQGTSGSEGAARPSSRSTPIVKQEPGTEEGPRLQDIPPAQPSTGIAKPSKEVKAPQADDAPLPPDPTTWKPKPGALPPPIPPGFGDDFGKAAERAEGKSMPANAAKSPGVNSSDSKQSSGASEAPLAGSPPVDLGDKTFSEGVASGSDQAGPEEGEWSDEDEDGDEDGGGEGEGSDGEGQQGTPEITDPKGLSAFEARLTPASPKRTEARPTEESTTPATDKKDSYTPAGLPKAPIMFAPPTRNQQESPRSPSPVRSATSPLRPPPTFSAQQPTGQTIPRQISRPPSTQQLPPSQPTSRTTSQAQVPQQPQRIAVPPAQLVQRQNPAAPPKPAEPDAGQLDDEEDARIQGILAAPIEPVKDVPAFLAHQDYVAGGERPGLGGQIERVYRDINSMIDTLALNARSLRGFVEGNVGHQHQEEQKERYDLEDEETWRLGEAVELGGIMEGIDLELEDGRLEDVHELLEGLTEDEKEMSRLRAKGVELRKQISARSDREQLANQHAAPLPMETQAQQSELRQGAQRVQKLLAKAEEQLSVLRAELSSLPLTSDHGRNGGRSVPTVEAVTNTILKMTAMIEKKSGDIDVLESQVRRLGGVGALHNNYEDDLAASMKASRLSNNSPSMSMRASVRASAYGSPAASRMMRSSRTPGTPGGKKSLLDVNAQEIGAYRAKADGRRRVMEALKEQLQARGPRVVKVGEFA